VKGPDPIRRTGKWAWEWERSQGGGGGAQLDRNILHSPPSWMP